MESLNNLVEAFRVEVVPDKGLGALLATPDEVEAFRKCKERLCGFHVDTLSQWLDRLVSELRELAGLANESLVSYLQRHIPESVLGQSGVYVNPTKPITIVQRCPFDMHCVLISEGGQDVQVNYVHKTGEPGSLKVAAHPRHRVLVAAERVRLVAYGETRLMTSLIAGNSGGQAWAYDYSQVYTDALQVFQSRNAMVCANRGQKLDTPEGYYWGTYASFGPADPRYSAIEQLLEKDDLYGLLNICRDVRDACGGVFPMSTVANEPAWVVTVYDRGLALVYDSVRERVFVQARMTEQELLREIWRHGMPEDASPCLLALPKQERIRAFIRDYRERGLRSLSLNGETGYLRYDKGSDTMQVVRPRCGGVIAAMPYDGSVSMSENIRLAAERLDHSRA